MSLCLVILAYACQKESLDNNSNSPNTLTRIEPNAIPYLGSEDKNYCKDCGKNSNPDYGCEVDLTLLSEDLVCVEKSSGFVILNDTLNKNNISELSTNIPYELRDSFLINFYKGQDYITYYNLISQVMKEKNALNIGNLYQHLSLTNKLITASNTLLHGASTDAPFDTSLKTEALAMISYYRSLESATYFQDILDVITIDITLWTGKTNAQIFALY